MKRISLWTILLICACAAVCMVGVGWAQEPEPGVEAHTELTPSTGIKEWSHSIPPLSPLPPLEPLPPLRSEADESLNTGQGPGSVAGIKPDLTNLPDLRIRPLLYWRDWANKPLNVVAAFLFSLLSTGLAWLACPASLEAGRSNCRSHFWKSLFTGIFVVALSLILVRFLFLSQIGIPLALLLVAMIELGVLLGLAVFASVLGERVVGILHLSPAKPAIKHSLELVLGVGLVSLLLLIPAIGSLPPIGIRLVTLTAILGLGALLLSRFKQA